MFKSFRAAVRAAGRNLNMDTVAPTQLLIEDSLRWRSEKMGWLQAHNDVRSCETRSDPGNDQSDGGTWRKHTGGGVKRFILFWRVSVSLAQVRQILVAAQFLISILGHIDVMKPKLTDCGDIRPFTIVGPDKTKEKCG